MIKVLLVFLMCLPALWFAGHATLEYAVTYCDSSADAKPKVHGLPEPQGDLEFVHPHAKQAILYFHGHGRSVVHNYWSLGRMYRTFNVTIKAFEFPSCRTGPKSAVPLIEAAQLFLLQHLAHAPENQRIVVLCASFGCNVALHAMHYIKQPTLNRINEIIFENPLLSIVGVLEYHMPLVPGVLWSLASHWTVTRDTLPGVPGGKRALIIVSDDLDEVVPPTMGWELAEWLATDNVVILYGRNHGNASAHGRYLPAIAEFFAGQHDVCACCAQRGG